MLRRVGQVPKVPFLPIGEASFPSPFSGGLEYGAPARGTWNIVHTGMLIPQTHQIFVCARCCLRGVVLTAAEMNAGDRFSTISVEENNLLDGDMEQLILDGVADILSRLKPQPRAVLLYTSCVHHFIGCDMPMVFRRLRENHPGVDFTDCYMNPIMRKSGLTPDNLMRRQLYSLLPLSQRDPRKINIIGNDFATDRNCELFSLLEQGGYTVTEIQDCPDYDSYLAMSQGAWNISYNPSAKAAGRALEKRLGQKHLPLRCSFSYEEIEADYHFLLTELGLPTPSFEEEKSLCEEALAHARAVIGDTPIVMDYTLTFRPLSLAVLLLRHGFRVTELYADTFLPDEEGDFRWIQAHDPSLRLYPTVAPVMRFKHGETREKVLALGQKAAYFTDSPYFVNLVECGGLFGFYGIRQMCREMEAAFAAPKSVKAHIEAKGLGCECCL